MPRRLIHHTTKRTAWRLLWSNDWCDRHPWKFKEALLPYVGRTVEVSNSAALTIFTIGPFALLVASTTTLFKDAIMTDLLIRTVSKFWDGCFLGTGILVGITASAKIAMWLGWVPAP